MGELIDIQNEYLYKLEIFLGDNEKYNINKFNYLYLKNNPEVINKLNSIFLNYYSIDDIDTFGFDESFVSLLNCYNNLVNYEFIDEKNQIKNNSINLLTQYFKDIDNILPISKEKEKNLFIEYNKTHDLEIKKRIMENNLKLVKHILFKDNYFTKFNIPVIDLIQYCNEELIKCIDNYNIDLGYKFSTYATKCIMLGLTNYINKYESKISIPKHKNILMRKYISLVNNCPANDIIDDEAFAKENGIDENLFSTLKFETTPFDDIYSHQNDLISDYDLFEEVSYSLLKNDLKSIINETLDYRHSSVLEDRFMRQMSLTEIADDRCCSPEYIRKLECEALRNLRKNNKVFTKCRDYI